MLEHSFQVWFINSFEQWQEKELNLGNNWVIEFYFRLVLKEKGKKELPQLSRSEFQEKISGPLERGGIAVDLNLLKMLSICQKSWESRFFNVIDSLVLLA